MRHFGREIDILVAPRNLSLHRNTLYRMDFHRKTLHRMPDHRKQVHRTIFYTKFREFLLDLMQKIKLKFDDMVFDELVFDELCFDDKIR